MSRLFSPALLAGLSFACLAVSTTTAMAQVALPGPEVSTSTTATFQGTTATGPTSDLTTGVQGGPFINAFSQSWGSVDNSIPTDVFGDGLSIDGALARARAGLTGTIGAYASSGGASPLPTPTTNAIFSSATASQVSNWVVNGSAGGTTAIDLDAALDGFLYGGNFAGDLGATPMEASVSLQMNVIQDGSSVEVFNGSGLLTVTGIGVHTFDTDFLTEMDDTGWNNSFTSELIGGDPEVLIRQDYEETFADLFTVDNNTPFAFEAILTTTANNQAGPFELLLTSDYFNTSSFDFGTSQAGSSIQSLNPMAVPEPGSFAFLTGLCSLGAVLRRRRRTPCASLLPRSRRPL